MAKVRQFPASEEATSPWIEELIVQNFKSLAGKEPYRIAVRPLTLLAGANSSGKSSAVQPLLLLKQTLEASFDPGPLRLSGPHLEFSSTRQIQSRAPGGSGSVEIGARLSGGTQIVSCFQTQGEKNFDLISTKMSVDDEEVLLFPDSSHEELLGRLPKGVATLLRESQGTLLVLEDRCFLRFALTGKISVPSMEVVAVFRQANKMIYALVELITKMVHVRGLRDNPQRTYGITAVGNRFPGPFEPYVASILQSWQEEKSEKLKELGTQLEALGLTWKVQVRQPNASELEVSVGRLPHARRGGAQDFVNIADVGFGVSQTLPVLVALLTAEPGQLVFLEQPEIHLHPKAQVALAGVLADAAKRGVRVIAETHSILLLTAVQALVAEGDLSPEEVILHWFERNEKGVTSITTRELDEQGRYGDWPEDFADTEMAVQSRYLDAVEQRMRAAGGGK